MSANPHCCHRHMGCCCAPLPPPPISHLLGPGIRRELMKYSTVRTVAFADHPWTRDVTVSYTLTNGQSRDVKVPFQFWRDEAYGAILDLVTKELGGRL